jgi:hypothetical protein
MIRWPFIVFCMASLAGAVQAQQLSVRSGDHPTFSRLTITVPQDQSWEAQQTSEGVELSLPGFSQGFDTADVFQRMRQNRVAAIEQTASTLVLKVSCDCVSTAFRLGALLVIDVADRNTPLAGPPLDGPAFSNASPQSIVESQEPIADPSIGLPWIGGASPFRVDQSRLEATAQTAQSNEPGLLISDRAVLLQEIQETLVEEVANAATIGLLEPNAGIRAPDAIEPQPILTESRPRDLPKILTSKAGNMRITSSRDQTNDLDAVLRNVTAAGRSCPAPDFLAIETWGNDNSFSAQIGSARDTLMNARDQLDSSAAKKLAKLYIFFGFGAEALNTIALDPSLLQSDPQLAAVATILERGALPHPNVLAPYSGCASDIALWATLSFREIPRGTDLDTDAALRALNKLPRHLRLIAAPALSDRLLNYGDPTAAEASMRSIERLPDPLTPEASMAQAGLAIEAGKSAEPILEEVIQTNTAQSPEALVRLVERTLAKDEPLSYETATLVEAYVQELRGTEMGDRLRRTQVIALSQSQHFDEAFEALEAVIPALSPTAANNLRQTVLEQLQKRASDLAFLEHVFSQKPDEIGQLPNKTKLLLASRMMDLGFGSQVQQILAKVPDLPRNSTRQILAARAALQLRQPFQAQAALIGIEETETGLLLAQAKEMTGAYREAAELFSATDAPLAAAQAAWLSDDWRDLTIPDTPGFGAIARLGAAFLAEEGETLGPLARASRALEESSEARGALEQLLLDPQVQVSPDS